MRKITAIFLTLFLTACGAVSAPDQQASFQPYPPADTPSVGTPTPIPTTQSTLTPTAVPTPAGSPEPGRLRIFDPLPEPFTGTLLPGQQVYEFVTDQNQVIHFLMYVPYSYDPQQKWPLILFLHSSLEVGSDLDILRERALPKKLENEKAFPFLVVSPQIAEGFWFRQIDALEDLMTQLQNTLPVDSQQVYLTGFSLGGYGTWAYAWDHPERFAAIAPVAGSLDDGSETPVPPTICSMESVPVWTFHGANDVTVDPHEDEGVIRALSSCGDETRITIFPATGHLLSGELAYASQDLYDWFLAHRKIN